MNFRYNVDYKTKRRVEKPRYKDHICKAPTDEAALFVVCEVDKAAEVLAAELTVLEVEV